MDNLHNSALCETLSAPGPVPTSRVLLWLTLGATRTTEESLVTSPVSLGAALPLTEAFESTFKALERNVE